MAYNEAHESAWSNVVNFWTTEEVVEQFELGDVNHDGAVNISDVTALIDYILGNGEIFVEQADLTQDGAVNISDVTNLIDKILGN